MFFVIEAILYKKYPNIAFQNFGVLSFFLSISGLFATGIIMFLRKENPYYSLLGMRIFSHGIVPQITGFFFMLVSGAGFVILFLY